MTLTLAAARQIITTTLAAGRTAGLKPLAVLVVDSGGHPIAFDREDGAPAGRFAIAHGKANACIMLGAPGSSLQAAAASDGAFFGALTGAYGGTFLPRKGGVLIRDAAGQIIGAIGVTGDTADNDMAVGMAAIEAAGFTAEG